MKYKRKRCEKECFSSLFSFCDFHEWCRSPVSLLLLLFNRIEKERKGKVFPYHHIHDETSPAVASYCHHICDGKIMEKEMKVSIIGVHHAEISSCIWWHCVIDTPSMWWYSTSSYQRRHHVCDGKKMEEKKNTTMYMILPIYLPSCIWRNIWNEILVRLQFTPCMWRYNHGICSIYHHVCDA